METERLISEITSDISSSLTDEEVIAVVHKHCANLGGENFSLRASLYDNLSLTPTLHTISNNPELWQKRYLEQDYLNQDLTISHCIHNNSPLLWPPTDKKLSYAHKKIFVEAAEFGINAGITFPYHGNRCEFAGFGVSTSQKFNDSELCKPENLFALQLVGASLFDFLKLKTKKNNKKKLTKREKECLKWVAAGKTSWETSMILNISERTVIFHIQNAATKMNTASRTNAAIIALMNGEI